MSVELLTVDSGAHKGTISALIVNDIACCWTLELPWNENKINVSCIPAGLYDLVLEWSPKKHRYLYEVKGVQGRSECKFHIANYLSELGGCMAPGLIVGLTPEKEYTVSDSESGFNRFMGMMNGQVRTTLLISNRPSL